MPGATFDLNEMQPSPPRAKWAKAPASSPRSMPRRSRTGRIASPDASLRPMTRGNSANRATENGRKAQPASVCCIAAPQTRSRPRQPPARRHAPRRLVCAGLNATIFGRCKEPTGLHGRARGASRTLSIAALLALRSRRSLRLCYIAGRRLPSHSDNLKTDGQLAYQSPLADGKNDA
jgi:hypothetical protein